MSSTPYPPGVLPNFHNSNNEAQRRYAALQIKADLTLAERQELQDVAAIVGRAGQVAEDGARFKASSSVAGRDSMSPAELLTRGQDIDNPTPATVTKEPSLPGVNRGPAPVPTYAEQQRQAMELLNRG